MKPRKRLQKRAFETLASAKIYVSDSRGYAVNYPWHACKWRKIKVSWANLEIARNVLFRMIAIVRSAWALSNGCKSRVSPNSGNYIAKSKGSRKFGDFRIHCMMDEIGKLHPQNIKGARNILLINSSPTTYNVSDYRYTYLLQKDGKSKTIVHSLISQKWR